MNKSNPFEQKSVYFNDSDHTYWNVKTGERLLSVTQLLHKFQEEFDPQGFILNRCAKRDGVTPAELKKQWNSKRDLSCITGSRAHAQLEYYFLNSKIKDDVDSDIIEQFKDIKFNGVVYPEILVYSTSLGIAGQADIAVYNKKDNSVAIQDLKTNEKMRGKVYKNLLPPLDHIPDSKINVYSLQISSYCYLLELAGYRIRADELCIYWVTPDRTIQTIPIPYLKNDVISMVNHHCGLSW